MTQQSTHLEILAVIKVGKKSFWNRIGTAFPTKDGNGYRLVLDYIPTSAETDIMMFPPKAPDGEGR